MQTPEIEHFIKGLAQRVVKSGLETPATLLLELHLPLTNIAHTWTLLFSPILNPLFGIEKINSLIDILSQPENISRLISEIKLQRQLT